jgi:SAM-dependent MidA family methyltransferase
MRPAPAAPLEALLAERIERSGPMPFAAFMSLALYHPKHGYYASGATRTGWRGHFLTSPELDPAYGELWSRGFEQLWAATGQPDEFNIVEIGPGEGAFARSVLDSAPDAFGRSLRYHLVERVEAVAERQRVVLGADPRVIWHASITEVPDLGVGCVFANEVLDNLPVHLARADPDGLKELCVELVDGGLALRARPPSNPELQGFLERVGVELQEGALYEVGLAAESLVARAAGIITAGAIVFVDYGATALELTERPNGSLLCYSEMGVDAEPLERPGAKDITVHANWTAVESALSSAGMSAIRRRSQRDVLLSLGSRELDQTLRAEHRDAVSAGRGAAAVAALSRRQALGALLDPGGLGGLQVLAGVTSGIALPWLEPISDQRFTG